MYEEGRSNFVRDLLVKIILIVLFIFLLIWLFPMPNLETFYDRIFAENIKTMQEAAKDYFTVDRLPKNVGDKKILTLKEMLDQKLIIEFIDKDGNKCDEINSFVEVVRMEKEFVFKTTLVCPTKTDYVVNHFGCYDICGDACGEVEKKELEYQFFKTYNKNVVDSYYCPAGYTLDSNKCIKTDNKTDTEEAEKKCDAGYTYNSNNNKCEKTVTTQVDADPCSKLGAGYSFVGGKCVKTNTTETLADPCSKVGADYKLQNGMCVKTTTTQVDADPCSKVGAGYKLQNGMCVKTTTTQVDADPCSKVGSGYTYNSASGKCEKPITLNGEVKTETKKSCTTKTYTSSKTVYSNDTFSRTLLSMDIDYNCTNSCPITYWTYKECNIAKIYSCADSSYTYENGICTKPSIEQKEPQYSCATGSVSGSKCLIPSTDTKPVNYSCTTGTLSGSKCIISTTDTKPVNYSCPVGTLSGVKCIITTTTTKDPVYSCTTGTVSGSKCIISSIENKDVTYVCKEGFTNAGTSCYKTSTIQDIIDATAKYKTVKQTDYTWSKEQTLNGWTPTGKTREVTCTTTCK